jgi:hypothetical protein
MQIYTNRDLQFTFKNTNFTVWLLRKYTWMNYKFESLKAIPQESKCRQSIQLDLLQQLGPAGSSSTISFSTNFSATKQKKKKKRKKNWTRNQYRNGNKSQLQPIPCSTGHKLSQNAKPRDNPKCPLVRSKLNASKSKKTQWILAIFFTLEKRKENK